MIITLLTIGSFSAYCAVAVTVFVLYAHRSLAEQARKEASVEHRNNLRHERFKMRMNKASEDSKRQAEMDHHLMISDPDAYKRLCNDVYRYSSTHHSSNTLENPYTDEKAPLVNVTHAIIPAILWPFGVWFLIGITLLDKIRINARDEAKRTAERDRLVDEAMQELSA